MATLAALDQYFDTSEGANSLTWMVNHWHYMEYHKYKGSVNWVSNPCHSTIYGHTIHSPAVYPEPIEGPMQPGGGARQQPLSTNCIDCKNKKTQEMKQVNKMWDLKWSHTQDT